MLLRDSQFANFVFIPRTWAPAFAGATIKMLSRIIAGLRRNDGVTVKNDRGFSSPVNPAQSCTKSSSSPNPARLRRATGFATYSLLELIIVIILVAVLFIVALENLLPLRGAAEKAHVEQTLGTLRSAVSLRTIELIAQNGLQAVGQLQHSNPMQQLEITPGSYRGEQATVNVEQLPPGSWVFETTRNTLLYKLRYPQYVAVKGPPVLRWRVQVNRNPGGSISGVAVSALNDYAWIESEGSETLALLGFSE